MKPQESLLSDADEAALQEQHTRALVNACRDIAHQVATVNIHQRPTEVLKGLRKLIEAAEVAQAGAVRVCRWQGWVWEDIGDAAGITRQGAMHRWAE